MTQSHEVELEGVCKSSSVRERNSCRVNRWHELESRIAGSAQDKLIHVGVHPQHDVVIPLRKSRMVGAKPALTFYLP